MEPGQPHGTSTTPGDLAQREQLAPTLLDTVGSAILIAGRYQPSLL